MKYLILVCALSFWPLFGATEMEEDVDAIMFAMFSFGPEREAQMNNVITTLASQMIEHGDKTMEMDVLVEMVKERMKSQAFAKNFYTFFENNFTPEEVKKLRSIYEDETFQRLQDYVMDLTQLVVQELQLAIASVIAENGQEKVLPILLS
jgi:hypothetical protein